MDVTRSQLFSKNGFGTSSVETSCSYERSCSLVNFLVTVVIVTSSKFILTFNFSFDSLLFDSAEVMDFFRFALSLSQF